MLRDVHPRVRVLLPPLLLFWGALLPALLPAGGVRMARNWRGSNPRPGKRTSDTDGTGASMGRHPMARARCIAIRTALGGPPTRCRARPARDASEAGPGRGDRSPSREAGRSRPTPVLDPRPDTTVAELAGWWLDVVARHRVRTSSFGKYEDRVNRIIETLGPTPVRGVTRERVATWQSDLLNPASPRRPSLTCEARCARCSSKR